MPLAHTCPHPQEAAEKYERARDNLHDNASAEAAELKRSCILNLSSCYLNLKDWDKCVTHCNLVLAGGWHIGGRLGMFGGPARSYGMGLLHF